MESPNAIVLNEAIVDIDGAVGISHMMIGAWLRCYERERDAYHSATLFCSIKMREIEAITSPLGRLNTIKTAISLDLLERIIESVRSRGLRRIMYTIRNEMIMAIYDGMLTSTCPSLIQLLNHTAFFTSYPDLHLEHGLIRRRISHVRISPGEFRDFESRKAFVISYQVARYERRLAGFVFRAWRLDVISKQLVLSKVGRLVDTRCRQRRRRSQQQWVLLAWQHWRAERIDQLNKRNRQGVVEIEETCERLDIIHGQASTELAAVEAVHRDLSERITSLTAANKARRLNQARLSSAVAKLGTRFAFQARLIAMMKGALPDTIGALFRIRLQRLSHGRGMGLQIGPCVSPSHHLQRRLQSRAITLSGDSTWDLSSPLFLFRSSSILQGDDCILAKMVEDLRTDPIVMKALLMDRILPLGAMPLKDHHHPIDGTPMVTHFADHPIVLAFNKSLNWANSLRSDLSSATNDCSLEHITNGFSLLRAAATRERRFSSDLNQHQNEVASIACTKLLDDIERVENRLVSQRARRSHAEGESQLQARLISLLGSDSAALAADDDTSAKGRLTFDIIFHVLEEKRSQLEYIFKSYTSAEGSREHMMMSNQEFWKFIRESQTIFNKDVTPVDVAEIWIDVVKHSDDLTSSTTATSSSSATTRLSNIVPKLKNPEEYFSYEIDFLQWEAILLRLACRKYATMQSRPRALLLLFLAGISSHSKPAEKWSDFLMQIASKQVRAVFSSHRAILTTIFSHYSKQTWRGAGSLFRMDFTGFQQLWMQMKLMDCGISSADLVVVFSQVGLVILDPVNCDSKALANKELMFPDFCQAIGAMSCFFQPVRNPFIPLEEKLTTFILKYLKPIYKYK